MKTKNIVIITISLLIGIILGVFIDNKFMNKESNSNKEITNQQTDTKALSLEGIKNNEILDKICGDYLLRKTADKEMPLANGIYINKNSDDTYNIHFYQTHAGGFSTSKILGIVKSETGNYYTIISILKEEKNEAYENLTSVNSINVNITDIDKGILYLNQYSEDLKIKYTKYDGEFNDWDKKDEFIKTLPVQEQQ